MMMQRTTNPIPPNTSRRLRAGRWLPRATTLTAALLLALAVPAAAQRAQAAEDSLKFEYFPFAMYDTDVGIGAGGNVVLRGAFGARERFELLLFASSKGERLLRLGFSLEDEELRQGTVHNLALDLLLDYDKMIQSNYFGVGSFSRFEDREILVHEPLLLQATVSRGFTPALVGGLRLRFKRMWSYGFEENSRLRERADNATTSDITSLSLLLRHDTRNSTLHTSNGQALLAEIEHCAPLTTHGRTWTRAAATAQFYRPAGDAVLALRIMTQQIFSDDAPVQHMHAVGGNRTLRGQPENRFLDLSSAVCNLECRIPLFRRFGLMLGVDAATVASTLDRITHARWSVTPVAGLRFAFDTFIVRGDVGWSPDALGVYLNIGQVF
jgi:hypothetical protein